MKITKRQLLQIIREVVGQTVPVTFSQLIPGTVFTVRTGRAPVRLTVKTAEPKQPGYYPASITAVNASGQLYSMTDDVGNGSELYLVTDEHVVWSGPISALQVIGR